MAAGAQNSSWTTDFWGVIPGMSFALGKTTVVAGSEMLDVSEMLVKGSLAWESAKLANLCNGVRCVSQESFGVFDAALREILQGSHVEHLGEKAFERSS